MYCLLLQLIVCLSSVTAAFSFSPTDIIVRTAQGKLRGSKLTTYTDKTIFAFRGVRYAESPTGDYRFKPPVPVRPWGEEIRDATSDAPVCPQSYVAEAGVASSEDCLFLNVYSKELSSSAGQPVLMYLHAGGYALGTGHSAWIGPHYLLEQNVTLVTINYRLGALGFVSTGDSILPGNYGMKDQVEALKWVQQNIIGFGGDPHRVTLLGYSAGGASVMLHMLSPLSRGLFQRAIAMSGSVTSPWALNRHPRSLALRLAHHLGCQTSDTRLVYACLMRASADQLVAATEQIQDSYMPAIALFAPVVEEGSDEGERFLPAEPVAMISSGLLAPVPLITGITRDEFYARGFEATKTTARIHELRERFNTLAPVEFMYERAGPRSLNISAAVRQQYLGAPLTYKNRQKLCEVYRDSLTTLSVVQAARLIAAHSSESVYLYQFSHLGRYSHNKYPPGHPPHGIAHHDDLIYLFYISKLFPMFSPSDADSAMVQMLSQVWTSFANTGVPTLPCQSTVWSPLTPGHDSYLNISCCPQAVAGLPHSQRMAFWERLFPPGGPHQQHY